LVSFSLFFSAAFAGERAVRNKGLFQGEWHCPVAQLFGLLTLGNFRVGETGRVKCMIWNMFLNPGIIFVKKNNHKRFENLDIDTTY
jgi:hypothetical protein